LSGLSAGHGKFFCTKSISVLRSSPVMVNVDAPGSLLGLNCTLVITPSMSTCGVTLKVTMRTTRLKGSSSGFCSSE
jgi:hypothetical protein